MTNKIIKRTACACIIPLMMLFGSSTALAADDPGFETLSDPFTDLTAEELADFDAGLVIFKKRFRIEGSPGSAPPFPPSPGGGPMANTFGPNSCVQCHTDAADTTGTRGEDGNFPVSDGKDGGSNNGFRARQATAYDEVAGTCDHLEDRGGPGFQINIGSPGGPPGPPGASGVFAFGLAPLAQEPANSTFNGEYVPILSEHGVPVGPLDDRTTNDLFGLGLLDALTDEYLTGLADPDDADGDGISGRVHWVTDHHGEVHAGKFGRKSEVAHLDEFNHEAFQNEQGVTNPEFPSDGVLVIGYQDPMNPDPQHLVTAILDDGIADEEVLHGDMDLLNAYVRFLAPPADNTDSLSKKDQGRANGLFHSTGCAACHKPKLKTGHHESDALSKINIFPYSDMLLHDMGSDLAEGCKGDATPNEWRTEPLWGLRFVPVGPNAFGPPMGYMHDGRSLTLNDAILDHAGEGSEANGAVDAYEALSQGDKDLLIAFLNTL